MRRETHGRGVPIGVLTSGASGHVGGTGEGGQGRRALGVDGPMRIAAVVC